jgi:hypothetical protein
MRPASQVHGSTQVIAGHARTRARIRVNAGTSMDPWTCPMVACTRIHHRNPVCTCPPCGCEYCLIRRLKTTFDATELDG